MRRYVTEVVCALLNHWMLRADHVIPGHRGREWKQTCLCRQREVWLDEPLWFGALSRAAFLQRQEEAAVAQFLERIVATPLTRPAAGRRVSR